MPPEQMAATTASPPSLPRVTTGLASFIFVIAAVAELLSMLLMTFYRYRAQKLEPEFFDPTKTGNVLGFLLASAFILLFLLLATVPRLRQIGLATTAIALSCGGLVLLSCAPLVASSDRNYIFAGYLAFKALEGSIFTVALVPRRAAKWRRIASVLLYTVGLIAGVYLLVIVTVLLSPISSTIGDLEDQTHPTYDAAVILGAAVWSGDRPSPVLRERINTGYDLLKNGTVQFLVLTGGNAPGELPEAVVARRELVSRGVDPTRIVLETHTSSTLEQALFIRDQLLKQGWRTFVIVSDQFHLTRAIEICHFNGIDAHGVSSESPLGPQNLALYHLRESVALILYWMYGV